MLRFHTACLFADRAYTDSAWAKFLKEARNVDILVPYKRPVNDPLRSGNYLIIPELADSVSLSKHFSIGLMLNPTFVL